MSLCRCFVLIVCVIVSVIHASSAHAQWGYTQNFNASAGTSVGFATVTGGELQLTNTTQPGGYGTWVVSPGVVLPALEVRFDLLIGGGTGADGFSFSYSDYDGGTVGEAGDATPGLSVGIHTFGTPYIDINYNGSLVTSQSFTSGQLRPGTYQPFTLSVTNQREVRLTWNGHTLTGTLPSWEPQASWDIILGARVGGANDNHFVDNLVVSAVAPEIKGIVRTDSNPRNTLNNNTGNWKAILTSPVQPAPTFGTTVGTGATFSHAGPLVNFTNDFATDAAPGTLTGSAAVNSGVLRLTEATVTQAGTWNYSPGTAANTFRSTFDLLIGNGNGADGLGFHYGPSNEGAVNYEGNGSGLSVVFDTYENGGEGTPNITIRYNNTDYAVVSRTLRTGSFVPVTISVSSDGICTVYHNGALVASAVLSTWNPGDNWDFALSAATGSFHDQHYVDNLTLQSGTYSLTRTGLADGQAGVEAFAGSSVDFNSPNANQLTPANFVGENYTIDFIRPTVTISSSAPNLVNVPIDVTLNTSESAIVSAGDIATTNATVTNFAGSGTTYTFTLQPTDQGAVAAHVPAGAIEDLNGNPNDVASNTLSWTYDSERPYPWPDMDGGYNITRFLPMVINIDTIEPTTNFDASDIFIDFPGTGVLTGSGRNYQYTFTPDYEGGFALFILENSFTDAAGNGNRPRHNNFRYDITPPTAEFIPTETGPLNHPVFVLVFIDSFETLDASDFITNNAVITDFNEFNTGLFYFTLNPVSDGAFGVHLPAGLYTDPAGNLSLFSSYTEIYDTQSPTPILTSTSPSRVNGPITVNVNTAEDAVGLELTDFTTVNATAYNFSGSGASYSFELLGNSEGPISVTLPDAAYTDTATNPSTGPVTLNRVFDQTAPTTGLAIADSITLRNTPATINITLSEDSTNLEIGDIVPTNATLSSFAGSGSAYTVLVTPDGQGIFSIAIPNGSYTDEAGNGGAAASISMTYDSAAPVIQSASPIANTTVASLASLSVTLSESVTGITAAALSVDGSPALSVSGTGAGPYLFSGWTNPGNGLASVALVGTGVTDAAGNALTTTSWSYTVNSALPSVILTSVHVANGGTENAASYDFSAAWSEAVSGFDATDVQVTNATVTDFVGTAAAYTFRVNPSADGPVSVEILANAATATAPPNNQGVASGAYTFTHDATPPSLTLNGDNPASVSCGNGYVEPGASAMDAIGGDRTNFIVVSGDNVAVNSPPAASPYEIVYTVADPAGNTAQLTRTVTVLDDCPLSVQPGGGTTFSVDAGDDLTLSVAVSGAIGTVVYDWQHDNGAKTWQSLGAPSSPVLTLSNIDEQDEGQYQCVVSDEVTTVVSPQFTLEVNTITALPLASAGTLLVLSVALALGARRKR